MKNQEHIGFSRRGFLKTASLVGGGMLIGFNFFTSCDSDTPLEVVDLNNLNFNEFNAYIQISNEGKIKIFSPNPEIGQGVKTAMPMLIAEELDVPWEDVLVVQGKWDTDHFQNQFAGGSEGIKRAWEPLRQTGATAKQMLINAAAAQWNVDASECHVEKGIIIHSSGKQLGYGEVALEAAKLEIPEGLSLKDPKDFKIIGQEIGNVDINGIITGKPLFGLDYKEEGMVYAHVLRPPAFGATLVDFDDAATLQVNGVMDVVQFGNKIAVIGINNWAAMKGQKALKANWNTDMAKESTSFHENTMLNALAQEAKASNGYTNMVNDGDVIKASQAADRVITRTYSTPFKPHNCMEPMNFFAHVTKEKVRLVGPIQTPTWTANRVADLLEREITDIQLNMTRQGGGFGRRLYGDFALEAAEISSLIKKPVQVVFSREDDMTAGTYRPAVKYQIQASLKDNELTGYHLKEAGITDNMYDLIPNFFPQGSIENYKVDVTNYQSNISVGAWRAPVTNFHAVAEQSFFDELATEMKVDPIQFRKDLILKAKDHPNNARLYEPDRLIGVIDLVVEKSNWGNPAPNRFQGFASYFCHNTHVAEVAEIEMVNGLPVVKKVYCAIDCGIVVNPMGAINQVKGGIIDGIGSAMYGELKFENGKPLSQNFHNYRMIRMNETPDIEVHFVKNNIAPTGLGEPALPPVGAAVNNAIFAATGKRLTSIPFIQHFERS
ncbi:MAG: molybdopterin cofactor-binding domain-containing protein [Salibacteraceae bacterium]